MRISTRLGALLALALAAGCGSSAAQNNAAAAAPTALTLRYAHPERPSDTLVIERDAAGRIRIEQGRDQLMVIRDGATHLTLTPPRGGERVVARLEDYLALAAEVRANMLRAGALSAERDDTPYSIRDEGDATVGQWRGRRYSLNPQESGVSLTVTISSDPALADARALAVQTLEALERVEGAVLIFPEQYVRLRADLLGRGMPISYDGQALTAIETTAIPEARFAVPGPVLGREALRARLMPGAPAPR